MIGTAGSHPKSTLRNLKRDAQRLSATLDSFRREAEQHLIGPTDPVMPLGADWVRRVDLFKQPMARPGHAPVANQTVLSSEVTAFTDRPRETSVSLRQFTQGSDTGFGPRFGILLDVYDIPGQFFSLAVALGPDVARDFGPNDLVRVSLDASVERAADITIRLNLRSGPNTEMSIQKYVEGEDTDFDLFYVEFDPARVSDAWIDIILAPQQMNRIEMRDLVVSRHARADL